MTHFTIPVELTFSKVNEAATTRINPLLALQGKPAIVVGAPNPFITLLQDLAFGSIGWDRTSPMAMSGTLDHPELIDLPSVDILLALGGDAIGLPVFFQLTDPTAPCPFSTKAPKDTWEQWGAPNATLQKIGAYWYRGSERVSNGGQPLRASEWAPIARNYTISLGDFLQIQKDNQVTI